MDYNEAIKILIEKEHEIEEYGVTDLAIEALEKQIPKKGIPYNSAKNHNFVECSACNKDIGMYYKYCPNCGQKLD